jgi:hypothetical protein
VSLLIKACSRQIVRVLMCPLIYPKGNHQVELYKL